MQPLACAPEDKAKQITAVQSMYRFWDISCCPNGNCGAKIGSGSVAASAAVSMVGR